MSNIKTQIGGGGTTSAGSLPVPNTRAIFTVSGVLGGGILDRDRTLYLDVDYINALIAASAGGGYAKLAAGTGPAPQTFTGQNRFSAPTRFSDTQTSGLSLTYGQAIVRGRTGLLGDVQASGLTITYGLTTFGATGGTRVSEAGALQVSGAMVGYAAATFRGQVGISGALSVDSRVTIRGAGPTSTPLYVSKGATSTPSFNVARFDDTANSTGAAVYIQHAGSGPGLELLHVPTSGPVAWLGDNLRVNYEATQISGLTVQYGGLYSGTVAAAQRYVTSGELGTGAAADTALRGSPNYFDDLNVFGANVTVSGAATHAVGGRYLPSGEVGNIFGDVAYRGSPNAFTAFNAFTATTTFSGAVNIRTATTAGTPLSVTSSVGKSSGLSRPIATIGLTTPFDRSSRPLNVLMTITSGMQPAFGIIERDYTDYANDVFTDTDRFAIYGAGNVWAAGGVQISGGGVISYGFPIWNQAQIGPNRYITSGELNAGAGSGDFVKAGSNFVTGASQVFGPSTSVTMSGQMILPVGTSGAYLRGQSFEKTVTLSGTGTMTVTGMLVGQVWVVSVRNRTTISGSPYYTGTWVGVSGMGAERIFGDSIGGAVNTMTTFAGYGTSNVPIMRGPTPLQLMCASGGFGYGGGKFAGGSMYITTYCVDFVGPTS